MSPSLRSSQFALLFELLDQLEASNSDHFLFYYSAVALRRDEIRRALLTRCSKKGLPRYHVENDNILPLTLIYFPIEIYNVMCKDLYSFDIKIDVLIYLYTCSQ